METLGSKKIARSPLAALTSLLLFILLSSLLQAQQGHVYGTMPEPPNLGILKQTIRYYIESGAYEADIGRVIDSARAYVSIRYADVQQPAIVLDIDETSLSNLSFEYQYDFGYEPNAWNNWVKEETAKPIKATRELVQWAREKNIAVFFITGRQQLSPNLSTDPTVLNLSRAGYVSWTKIYFKPADAKMTTVQFKTNARKEISKEGYTIIANIGDQYSDLEGGYAERAFKLPNPMYYIP
ncbi:MAG: HAD family acid phosphatase [Bacteroidota bacterium]